MDLPDPWGFFDRIYCISIDDRHDRRAQAREQFASVGLLARVEFVIVAKHPDNRVQGIYESHLSCLHRGLSAGAKNIMVFEDDILFRRFNGETLKEACATVARLDGWDGLFLGCITSGSRTTSNRSLVRIRYRCLAHAYALDAVFARQLVERPWGGVPFDEVLRRSAARFYALSPMCAFQGLAGTDNQTILIDRMRRLFGGLPLIQRVNEVFQRHKPLFLLLHLILPAVLCLLIFDLW